MNKQLYCHIQYKGYNIFVNTPEWEHSSSGGYEGFVYFSKVARGHEVECQGDTGEECLQKCKEWVDGIIEKGDEL